MYTHDLTRRLAPSSHPTSECSHTHHDTGHHHGHSHGGLHTHTPRVHSHIRSRATKQSTSTSTTAGGVGVGAGEDEASEEMATTTPVTSGAYGPLALLANTSIYRTLEKAMPSATATATRVESESGSRSHQSHGLTMNDERYEVLVGGGAQDDRRALASLLLLACPQQVFTRLPSSVRAQIDQLRNLSTLPSSIQGSFS
jgi:hypothetical protein